MEDERNAVARQTVGGRLTGRTATEIDVENGGGDRVAIDAVPRLLVIDGRNRIVARIFDRELQIHWDEGFVFQNEDGLHSRPLLADRHGDDRLKAFSGPFAFQRASRVRKKRFGDIETGSPVCRFLVDRGPARLDPLDAQSVAAELVPCVRPRHFDRAGLVRQGAVFGRVRRQVVKRQADGGDRVRFRPHAIAGEDDPIAFRLVGCIGRVTVPHRQTGVGPTNGSADGSLGAIKVMDLYPKIDWQTYHSQRN